MASLNPTAKAFSPPIIDTPWTIRNPGAVEVYAICKFHNAQRGNLCKYGDNCRYIHYAELDRPCIATTHQQHQDTLSQILQVVTAILQLLQSTMAAPSSIARFAQPANKRAQLAPAPEFPEIKEESTGQYDDDNSDMDTESDAKINDDNAKLNGVNLRSTEEKLAQSTPTNASDAEPTRSDPAGNDEQFGATDQALRKLDETADIDEVPKDRNNLDEPEPKAKPTCGKHFENILDTKVDNEFVHDREPIGGKPYEDIIETKTATETTVDAKSTTNDFTNAKIDTSYDERRLSPKGTKQLWTFMLANNPHALIAKYPKLRKQYVKQQYLGKMDAILVKLKKTELNGKPVIIRGRVKNRGRFIVEFHDYSKSPKSLRIKDENLQTLKPRPTLEAFSIFKSDIEESSWAILTVNDSCFHNDNILYVFLSNQFPFYDGDVAENPKLKKLCVDTVKMAKAKGMGVTQRDCPKIISLLYCLAFNRKIHIVRIFQIPSSWTPQLWSGEENLFVLLPPNDPL